MYHRRLSPDREPLPDDFFSNSCPPCRRLSPTIHELAEEYKGRATVCKVDLDL
ncbi:MAG: thiol reductase thioredoxin, partial [Spartobacteria bacterium]|nr:thiol reductase thioredoxin [Spartobacteria bacterium]